MDAFNLNQLVDFVIRWEKYSISFDEALQFVAQFAASIDVEIDKQAITAQWKLTNHIAEDE